MSLKWQTACSALSPDKQLPCYYGIGGLLWYIRLEQQLIDQVCDREMNYVHRNACFLGFVFGLTIGLSRPAFECTSLARFTDVILCQFLFAKGPILMPAFSDKLPTASSLLDGKCSWSRVLEHPALISTCVREHVMRPDLGRLQLCANTSST